MFVYCYSGSLCYPRKFYSVKRRTRSTPSRRTQSNSTFNFHSNCQLYRLLNRTSMKHLLESRQTVAHGIASSWESKNEMRSTTPRKTLRYASEGPTPALFCLGRRPAGNPTAIRHFVDRSLVVGSFDVTELSVPFISAQSHVIDHSAEPNSSFHSTLSCVRPEVPSYPACNYASQLKALITCKACAKLSISTANASSVH